MAPNAELVLSQVAQILQFQDAAGQAALNKAFHQLSSYQKDAIVEYFAPEYQKQGDKTGIPDVLKNLFNHSPQETIEWRTRYVVHIGLNFLACVIQHAEEAKLGSLSFATVAKTAEQFPFRLCGMPLEITPEGEVRC
jgi:hypothetical protein